MYLQYWRKSEYAKFLKYPQCLHFLELLQYEHFRKELVNSQCAKFIDDQQLLHWQHYARKRIRLQQMQLEAQQQRQQQQQPQQSGAAQPMMQQGNDIPPLQQLQNHQNQK
ncbi:mediator of RNA polymerase II transcription subunit 31-like [Anneissia japonica]|uniref:mediator of RNA polymerase II transcription subunit 31-like n=1 Tax=Anneissia japonica TaxID=1529436 RepID=UPI0014257C13|nr:mediator of RNA polymerase II transcription subunit 31-like [Anneissia japonica]